MSRELLELPEIRLAPIEEGYLAKMRRWRNDPRVYRWCRQFEPITDAHHKAWFDGLNDDTSTKMYAVMKSGTHNIFLGVCGLTSIDWVNRRAEFSLYIDPGAQGKGYGEAALRRLLKVGFEVLNLNCIWGEAFEGNPAVRMFERVGFKSEGERREFYYRDGKYINAKLFSILRSEYA
ncbi:MAG TPA: GNAT family protein [Blastocatellia bacterium]|nr:GNAT family protein [Blastocatellia bacterium]